MPSLTATLLRPKTAAILALLICVGFAVGRMARSASAPISRTAFTIQYTYTSKKAEGTVILSQHKFVARREDGSIVSGFVVDDMPGVAPTLTRNIQLTD
jgi:hypothetical protein